MKGWDWQLNMSFFPWVLMPCLCTFTDKSQKPWCSSGLQKVAVKLCDSEFLQSSFDRSIPVLHNKEKSSGVVDPFLMPACSPNEEISLQGE